MGEISQKCIKWLMFGFNLLFWITGLTLIIAGAVAQSHYKEYSRFVAGDEITVTAPVLLIIVGVFISVVAFLGCCGAARENYSMLMGFAVIVSLIFVTQLAGGIAGYVQKGKIASSGNKVFAFLLNDYVVHNSSRDVVDELQKDLGCCGSQNYTEWFGVPLNTSNVINGTDYRNGSGVVQSCCRVEQSNCTTADLTEATVRALCPLDRSRPHCKIYTEGCQPKIQSIVEAAITGVAGAAIGLAFIQLIGIVFACYLAQRIRKGYVYA